MNSFPNFRDRKPEKNAKIGFPSPSDKTIDNLTISMESNAYIERENLSNLIENNFLKSYIGLHRMLRLLTINIEELYEINIIINTVNYAVVF